MLKNWGLEPAAPKSPLLTELRMLTMASFMRLVVSVFLVAASLLLLSGCDFMRLKKEVKVLDQIGSIQGRITNESPQKKPVIVLMYQFLPEGKKLVAYSIYHQSNEFHFRSAPGQYMLAAFEDANEDMMYQASEYAGYCWGSHHDHDRTRHHSP